MRAVALCVVLVVATLWAASWLVVSSEGRQVPPSPVPRNVGRGEPVHETRDHWEKDWIHSYFGTLDGAVRIGLTVERSEAGIRGLYFEALGLVDHPVELRLGEGRAVSFVVRDRNGQVAATLRGEFARTDPAERYAKGIVLQREVIVGILSTRSPPASRTLYLNLSHSVHGTLKNMYRVAGVADDRVVNERAAMLQRAVAAGDRSTVAGMVRFPIWVRIGGTRVQLASEERFLKVYDRVFEGTFTDRIAEAIPHHMFSKYSGVMLGDGEVWFDNDGSVGAINN